MFEHQRQPLISQTAFLRRVASHFAVAGAIVFGSLGIGVLGYHFLEGQDWIDALVNAAMLLGGMGPIGELYTIPGKLFAAAYALYAGLIFLIVAGVLFAPIFHRFLHHFHWELTDDDDKPIHRQRTK